MKFTSFYSSSKSNFYVVTAANGTQLLIECGCTWKKLIKALDYKLENVVGCLLSHEHADHSKAVEDVIQAGIDVYSRYGTFDSLGIDGVDARRAYMLHNGEYCQINGPFPQFTVLPFSVCHDAVDPIGFVINSNDNPIESMLFVTDTSHIKQQFTLKFNIIALCCNYDGETLHALEEAGKIDTELAKRLLTSHMEWHETKRYIKEFCNLDRCTEIHLLHMSPSNIDAEKVRSEFEREFMTRTLVAGRRR